MGAGGQNESNSGVRLMRKLLSAEQYNSMRTNDPVLLAKDLYARHQLFMIINAQDGNQLSAALPSKKELPDYYEVISEPMDISKIWFKIEDGEYDSIGNVLK